MLFAEAILFWWLDIRFDVNPHGSTLQKWNGIVELDTRASPEQRHAAIAINLSRCPRLGG